LRIGRQQRFQLRFVGRLLAEPGAQLVTVPGAPGSRSRHVLEVRLIGIAVAFGWRRRSWR
jgi:hypothetical protein